MTRKKKLIELKKRPMSYNNQLTYEELYYYLQCII